MDEALEKLALAIDQAADAKDSSKLAELREDCATKVEQAKDVDRVTLRFYEANCYGALTTITRHSEGFNFSWDLNEQVSEILTLRKAINEEAFDDCDPLLQCKILTNAGNRLSQLGRTIEAIHYWNEALNIIPNFAMAKGNLGSAFIDYAYSLYDHNHALIIFNEAFGHLGSATMGKMLWDSGEHPEAKQHFIDRRDHALKIIHDKDLPSLSDLDKWPLGDTPEEQSYRAWCLSNKLFLSPLNDVFDYSVAAHDPIHLPDHSYDVGEDFRFPKYYNILKQEYIAARYMLFEALKEDSEHLSDKEVLLLSGLDGVYFGYQAEQLKTAFRLTYSLFDKIALFINDYFSIGMDAGKVNFRTIWSQKNKQSKKFEVRSEFENSKNLPLRGLYYLSKDLSDENFKDTSLPDAKKLADLRNRIEHRFLSLQDYPAKAENTDTLKYITKDEFERKALRILSMAREALIYLSLAMYREETIRNESKDKTKISAPIFSHPIKR